MNHKLKDFLNWKSFIAFALFMLIRLGFEGIHKVEFLVYCVITAAFITVGFERYLLKLQEDKKR